MNPITNSPLFEGLDSAALNHVMGYLRRHHYQRNEYLCRLGESGDSLFVIEQGLVEVVIDLPHATTLLDRLRPGDIVGEMALITGERRAASVAAVLPTVALELTREGFAAIIAQYPNILLNINQILIQRQKRSNAYFMERRRRGEAIALLMGDRSEAIVADTITGIQNADPHGVAVIDLTGSLTLTKSALEKPSVATTLAYLDNLLVDYRTVIVISDPQRHELPLLVKTMDRITLIATGPELRRVNDQLSESTERMELVLLAEDASSRSREVVDPPVLRTFSPARPKKNISWLRRHLTRKKIGLALGAGGAKGFAHVGALEVLQEAGYTIDFIAGSSIGGLVGGLLAMGMDTSAISAAMQRIWSPDHVAELGVFSRDGLSIGLRNVLRATREEAGSVTFRELKTPLTIMTADLNAQQPAPILEGALGEALCAGMTIPGMAPPYLSGSQRLVDGIAIMPVPTTAVREAGADIVISINLLNRETLAAWPSTTPDPPSTHGKSSRGMDPVIETLIMMQMDGSIRNAAKADVVITPRFGPMSWRDFFLADLAREAGRRAAEEQLPRLLSTGKPL